MASGWRNNMDPSEGASKNAGMSLDESEVADFLRSHPDFFERHLALLSELVVPHSARGGTVSLLERQVGVLRDQLSIEKNRLASLIDKAKENSRLQQRLQRCFERIARTRDMAELLDAVPRVLQAEFGLVTAVMQFTDHTAQDVVPIGALVPDDNENVALVIRRLSGKACLLEAPLSDETAGLLDPASAAQAASCAVLPMVGRSGKPIGWIILVSGDPEHYRPDMDTILLEGLAGLIGASCIRLGLS
jgi:uncharacterized protein YigA (DUF484 family)